MTIIRFLSGAFSLVLAIVLIHSCSSDRKTELELLQGTWVLKEATRNEKPTRSLDGMYMIFDGESSFESNILGDSSTFNSTVTNGKIIVDHSLITRFDIEKLNDTLMKLSTGINEDEIQLVFNK